MKTRLIHCLAIILTVILIPASVPLTAAERLCSIYVDSIANLQSQVQQAAMVFDSPELGMFPVMITMLVPGGSQVNVSEPVSLHIFDLGDGTTGGILELTPATTAEMFLKSMTAATGKPLAPAVNGRYTFDGGVAQVAGPRLLLARHSAELDACTGGAVPALPPMPALDGTIRIAMAPSAAVPALNQLKAQWETSPLVTSGPQALMAKELQETLFGLYIRALAQINTLEIGLAIEPDGIVIRKRMSARAGSTVAGIIRSVQPVDPSLRAFVNPDALFSMATGRYTLPEPLTRQMTRLYLDMLRMAGRSSTVDVTGLDAMLEQSVAAAGAAMAVEVKMPFNNRLLLQGALVMPNAAAYLDKMAAFMQTPSYQSMMAGSGIRIQGPEQRLVNAQAVHTWTFALDEEALRKTIAEQSPGTVPDPAAFEQMNKAIQAFGSTYEYAAVEPGLAFGMGSPAMVAEAINRLQAAAPADGDALRIRQRLCPSAAPAVIGRFAIVDAVRLMLMLQTGDALPSAVADAPAGDGIVFTNWIEGTDVKRALLIPAADVKALRTIMQSMRTGISPAP